MQRFWWIWLLLPSLGVASCFLSQSTSQLNLTAISKPSVCEPSPALLELLAQLDVKHGDTMPSIIEATQKAWLRKPGTERWQIPAIYENRRREIMPLLGHMNLIDTISPSKMHYDYAVVLGSLLQSVRNRLDFLLTQWEQGVRFNEIVFLGGERFLEETMEPTNIIIKPLSSAMRLKKGWRFKGEIPKTETDMMKIVFAQTQLPKGMEKIKVVFVHAPAKQVSKGQLSRPNTGDTVHAWLQLKPAPGTVLAISSQPVILYQDAVLKTLLPSTFRVETAGAKASDEVPIGVYLDNIARLLYQRQCL